jgi:hypothetical protein
MANENTDTPAAPEQPELTQEQQLLVEAAKKMQKLEEEIGAMANILTVLVRRNGGEIRIHRAEFATIGGYKVTSAHSRLTDEQVLTAVQVDVQTGEERKSQLIVPGRIPLDLL